MSAIPVKKEEAYSYIPPQERDNTRQFSIANRHKEL